MCFEKSYRNASLRHVLFLSHSSTSIYYQSLTLPSFWLKLARFILSSDLTITNSHQFNSILIVKLGPNTHSWTEVNITGFFETPFTCLLETLQKFCFD